jgi:cytokinin dehydrogenase
LFKTARCRKRRLRSLVINHRLDTAMTDSPPSRRRALQALGVVGFCSATATWVTAAQAHTQGHFDNLPFLDGTLHLDEATRAEYAQDYGRIVSEQPLAVLRPGSVHDIRRMVFFARRHGIRIVGRGRGHSAFGQSQVKAGVVIDISTLQTIHEITPERIDVDAGIRWNALLQATLQQGLRPPALTDYIGQSVGGTLSVGGIGSMVHRQGAQVDNVLEVQVVTGSGHLVTCSEHLHRELFDAVLAGQGQVGLIVRATLKLVAAPARIRVFNLIYTELTTLTAEIERLMKKNERFDTLEAFGLRQSSGAWIYLLQAGHYYTPPAAPDDAALLTGLQDLRSAMSVEDTSFSDYANRVPVTFQPVPRPGVDVIVPSPAADGFVLQIEQTLKPLVAGDSFSVLLIPMKTTLFSRPLFRAPKTEFAFGVGILRRLPDNGAQVVAQALAYNRWLFDQARDIGATHYPVGALQLDREDWKRLYGPAFGRLQDAKCRFDPDNVFAGGPDIF